MSVDNQAPVWVPIPTDFDLRNVPAPTRPSTQQTTQATEQQTVESNPPPATPREAEQRVRTDETIRAGIQRCSASPANDPADTYRLTPKACLDWTGVLGGRVTVRF